ncbi:HNH endonuclease [Bacillus shivajii]|uniref:HNH endonuclease n=1 Tax=Bacillus shivajii TaxID=1983719 RepID=UPI001CFC2292|nr:HNH endonuclease [Bacillus shivajii]UCZ54037.1 HNH endonuclease [Bacillus shivajii]
MKREEKGQCQLCERDNVILTEHHLIPKEEGGTFMPTARLCIPCHKQTHHLYTNKELAIRLYTIERLKDDESIKRFLKWIKKQPSQTLIKVKKSHHKRQNRS